MGSVRDELAKSPIVMCYYYDNPNAVPKTDPETASKHAVVLWDMNDLASGSNRFLVLDPGRPRQMSGLNDSGVMCRVVPQPLGSLEQETAFKQDRSVRILCDHGSSRSTPVLISSPTPPWDFLLTDPLGRSAGVDPRSGASFADIPGSRYSKNPSIETVPSPGHDGTATELDVRGPVDGIYRIQVIGNGTGDALSSGVLGTLSARLRASDGRPSAQLLAP